MAGMVSYQDCPAAKGFWIGTTNFTDGLGAAWPYKVVHVGPRVRGTGEFVPIKFEMVSKYAPPEITVDGSATEGNRLTTTASIQRWQPIA